MFFAGAGDGSNVADLEVVDGESSACSARRSGFWVDCVEAVSWDGWHVGCFSSGFCDDDEGRFVKDDRSNYGVVA